MSANNQGSASPAAWSEMLKGGFLAGLMVLFTAISSGAASYVATWNIEAQKVKAEKAVALENEFQQELSEVVKSFRKVLVVYAKSQRATGKENIEAREELMGSILNIQFLFHPRAGKWPDEHIDKARELVSLLGEFRGIVETASSYDDLVAARDKIVPIISKKDELFAEIRKKNELSIFKFVPFSPES